MSLKPGIAIFFLLVIGLFACRTKPESTFTQSQSQVDDSLYTYVDYKGLVDISIKQLDGKNLLPLDSNTMKKVLQNFPPLPKIVCVAKQHTVGNVQPIIIRVTADDYIALVMLTLNKNQKVLDKVELSGGDCAGPDEADSILAFCPDKYSLIIDSNHIQFYKITRLYPLRPGISLDSAKNTINLENYDTIPVMDSMSYNLEIKPNGKIISTLLDSVRIDMHKTTSKK